MVLEVTNNPALVDQTGAGWAVLGFLALVGIIWMFVDMLSQDRLGKKMKGVWTVLFVAFAPITAIVWAFVRK